MDKQKREAREMVKNLSFKEKLSHFWYYYKKHTIAGIFATIVVVWGTAQCIMQTDYDLNISYYTCRYVDEESLGKLENELESVVEDINENESKDVFVSLMLGDISRETPDEMTQAAYSKLVVELSTNDCFMYLVDKPYFELINNNFGQIVENVILLNDVPVAKEILGLGDEEVYLLTISVFESYQDKEEYVREHENALLVQKYFQK